jgi:asparagine synthase (glutamine-hydrolysing)
MCGIAGRLDGNAAEVEAMLARIAHRGPDEAGLFADPHIALGTVRLKVVDLNGGQQPMLDSSARWCIAYNGEVYNFPELRAELETRGHRFTGHSDTEVVLNAWVEWGPQALARLEGGFAFALFDRRTRELALARDRYGKRPLYYTQQGGVLRFASEMKAFFADPQFRFEWDETTLGSLFRQWTCIEGETPFAGIHQVPPGHWLQVSEGRLQLQRWGAWPRPGRASTLGFEAAAEQAAGLLRGSVTRRLRSDVEVGVMLSGGLDSAIIATLIREAQPGRLRSYSVAFDQAEFDESSDQALMAERLGIEHHRLQVGAGTIADSFADALWHAEQPQFRTAFVPMYLLSRAIRADGVVVVLSGEGADEVFLGYDLFKETRLRAAWLQLEDGERRRQLAALYPYLPHFNADNAAALGAVFARSVVGSETALFPHALRLENGQFAQRLLRGGGEIAPSLQAAAQAADIAALQPLDRAQWAEVSSLLQGYLLSSQGDRMAFAHGVEPRNPFLAPDVAEFAATLPEAFHLSAAGREKHLLKQAFGPLLPARIVDKPKQPYRAPDAASFLHDGALLPWVHDALKPERLAQVGPLDAAYAQRFVARLGNGRPPSPREEQAFVLLLSLVLLDGQFVQGRGRDRVSRLPPLRRRVEPAWAH